MTTDFAAAFHSTATVVAAGARVRVVVGLILIALALIVSPGAERLHAT